MIELMRRLLRQPLLGRAIDPAGACRHGRPAWLVDGRGHHETGASTAMRRVLAPCDEIIGAAR